MGSDPEVRAHLEWLGFVQPIGLVVSPPALVAAQAFVDRNIAPRHQEFLRHVADDVGPDGRDRKRIADLPVFFTGVLGWEPRDLAGGPGGPALPEGLVARLADFEETLVPTYAVMDPEPAPGAPPAIALVQSVEPAGSDLDAEPAGEGRTGFVASPEARFERLLREAKVPVGLLFNGTALRLVYAPSGESSGHVTFPVAAMAEVGGRPIFAALHMLLSAERLFPGPIPRDRRLPRLLSESRKYQNDVSTRLAEQVLGALYELVRGFQAADDAAHAALLSEWLSDAAGRREVYGGLVTTLLRMVFVLYAEDRGLLPGDPVFVRGYSLGGLFARLRDDDARHHDTMDQRHGAWPRLLTLFRLVHDGAAHGDLRLPPRHGELFDPDRYPFLEGRRRAARRATGERVDPPRVADGVIWRVLERLLMLDGERLSYRALDVEQIGSVYEAMMGFEIRRAEGTSIALKPEHVVVDLDALLATPAAARAKRLADEAGAKVTGAAADGLKSAGTIDDLLAALEKRISKDRTPGAIPKGGMYLQPTPERRRSGSHYTPRSLTRPIVETTFRPILALLGPRPRPEAILALKVCDPAMGSGAFLVESCRFLAERLVEAWQRHRATPRLPPDEEPLLHAKRVIAQRCLYGVDKNPFAVQLAKLSLWLATLARDHPFTFLDHALREGDSLVGLTREQIAEFHWAHAPGRQMELIHAALRGAIADAERLRAAIHALAESDDADMKGRLLAEAEAKMECIRLIADAAVSAFFAEEKDKAREARRANLMDRAVSLLGGNEAAEREVRTAAATLRGGERGLRPFHWEIEFPEVFSREDEGFDAIIGNPPFLGGSRMSTDLGLCYENYLKTSWPDLVGKLDLVVFFFHRASSLLRRTGVATLIATYRIADGANALVGLRPLTIAPWEIFWAHREQRWPGAAATRVSQVAFRRASVESEALLDGRPVDHISCDLRASTDLSNARDLSENEDRSFIGAKPDSLGFLLTDEERDEILSESPAEVAVMRRYLIGNDLTKRSSFDGSRWIIDFSSVEEERAKTQFPRCYGIVSERVRPGRMELKRAAYRDRWWQFTEPQNRAHSEARTLPRVIGISRVTKYVVWHWIDPSHVIADKVAFVVSADAAMLGVLQSVFHEYWALRRGGKFGVGGSFSYSPTTCFRSFPFPKLTADLSADLSAEVRQGAEAVVSIREKLARMHSIGLTELYNRFHDRESSDLAIHELRRAHQELDRMVARGYGWLDLELHRNWLLTSDTEEPEADHDESESGDREEWRYSIGEETREIILSRLLALNEERWKEEQLSGAAAETASKETAGTPGRKRVPGGKKAAGGAPKTKKAEKPAKAKKSTAGGPGLFDG